MLTMLQIFTNKLAPKANQPSTYATSAVNGTNNTQVRSVVGGDIGNSAGQPVSVGFPLSIISDIHKSVVWSPRREQYLQPADHRISKN